MPQDLTEDHYELEVPGLDSAPTAKAAFWYDAIQHVVQFCACYESSELATLTQQHVSPLSVLRGFGRLGKRHMLGGILRELRAYGLVRKFQKGIYVQSGRPYGVLWMIKWN